jgi:hypothetical protein
MISHLSLHEPVNQHADPATDRIQHLESASSGIRNFGDTNDNGAVANNGRRAGLRMDEGASTHGAPFPVFLTDSHVGGAIQRANTLHLQRHGYPAIPPTAYPRSNTVGHTDSSYSDPQIAARDSPFPVSQPTRESPPRDSIPAKFTVPGQETASVLQISKRPRLRQKDLAHRQSLVTNGNDADLMATLAGRTPGLLQATPPLQGYSSTPVVTPLRFGDYSPPPRPADNFMALLRFGQRKVGVATSLRMSVHELQETAAQIAGLPSADIALMLGDTYLPPDGILGDFVYPNEARGTIISVVSSVGLRGSGVTPSISRLPAVHDRTQSPGPSASSSMSSASDPDGPIVYMINIVYEDGNVALRPVAPSMLVRHLQEQVAFSSGVEPNIVTLVYQGVILELDRRLSDPPPIERNAYVYVFFGVQAIPHLPTSGGGLFPPGASPPTPPTPPTHGPDLPPGFVRRPPTTNTSHALPAPGSSYSRGSTASDKLRTTFRCPKFLGEARHWKAWHKGFIRFISIQMLDYVLADDFPHQPLTTQRQEDNKLVYYVLEEAVSGSPIAAKYVRRAPEWDGHTAYVILYDGYSFSGPAEATLLLSQLNNFRFTIDETASELCLRLQELFEDLEAVLGTSSITFGDTQKINYLLSAIRHERSLSSVYAMIQTDQLRGRITFDQACEDLRYRCEALRADDLLNTSGRPGKVRALAAISDDTSASPPSLPFCTEHDHTASNSTLALITTANKRQNAPGSKGVSKLVECIATGCVTLTPKHLRLCRVHYHECIAGKHSSLSLKTGDSATYNATTNKIIFPHLLATTDKSSAKRAVRALAAGSSSTEHSKN